MQNNDDIDMVEVAKRLKGLLNFTDQQLEIIDLMCYVNTSAWNGDVNELIRNESKRELALTLRGIADASPESLAIELERNGGDAWLNQVITLHQ